MPRCPNGCPEASSLNLEMSIEDVKAILESHDRGLPGDFFGYGNVAQAFRELLVERRDDAPPPPAFKHKRGIVICGGGWRFFPSVYVTVRMIRRSGCELPIQVWYLGDKREFDPRMLQCLQDYNVGWICANSFVRENHIPARILGGWECKPLAAAYCEYETVISLDADSYPAYNPETFLDHPEFQRVGAAFWPDNGQQLEPGQWERFGLAHHVEPAWESGQFIVDKSRHWRPLWLTWWMNQRSDYVYKHLYGDKDTFHLCWRLCGHEVCVPGNAAGWHVAAFLQRDFNGRTLFVHRTRDKFRLTGALDGAGINGFYMTRQHSPEVMKIPGLPHEEFGHASLREVDELLRPEKFFEFVDGPRGWCRDIWDSVNLRNEYQLPRDLPADSLVVDIGAHVGAFTRAAIRRGAAHVIAVEPLAANVELLNKNVAALGDLAARVTVRKVAVNDRRGDVVLTEDYAHVPGNTSTITMFGPRPPAFTESAPPESYSDDRVSLPVPEHSVDAILIDDVLEWCAPSAKSGRVHLLKIDAEGAEFPALMTMKRFDLVDQICGEIHNRTIWDGAERSDVDIRRRLAEEGFYVDFMPNGPTTVLFWARKVQR